MSDDRVEIDVEEVRRTADAILVKDADDIEHWIPLSQCCILSESIFDPGGPVVISMPEWLAIKEGLV